MDKQLFYERIESYLDGSMAVSARLAFEQEMSSDAELAKEVALHRQIHSSLQGEKIHAFRKVLQVVDAQWSYPGPKTQHSGRLLPLLRPVMAIAASLAILFMAWQFLIRNDHSDSGQRAFETYFEPYPMILHQRSASEEQDSAALLNKAIQDYAEGRFAEAALSFQQLEQAEPDHIVYSFYRALALLSSGQADQAIPILDNITARPGHLFSEQGRWYLALALWETGRETEAREMLEGIRQHEFRYSQSRELLAR